MKKSVLIVLTAAIGFAGGADVFGQAQQTKGIDTQTQQIKDISTQRGPTDNGNKQNVGTGRGIDFGRGKAAEAVLLANPYRIPARRDILLASIADVMRERNLTVDDQASRLADGVLISQPYTFSKGAVLSASQLERFANLPSDTDEAWSGGRYTLTVEVQTIDGVNNNVSVTAKVEGRSASAQGSSWLTLTSSGAAENDFLAAVVERVTGTDPTETAKPADASKDDKAVKNRRPQP